MFCLKKLFSFLVPRHDLTILSSQVHRWRPVASGGFAHATTATLIYKGFIIPAGTSIVGNHWSISRDPAVFVDPESFNPDRWIIDGEIRKDLNHVGFGFGRRICSGKNVADRSLFSK